MSNAENTTDQPVASPTSVPHLLQVSRQVLAHLGAVKEATILLATVSFLIEEKWFGVGILLIRGLISYYERVSVVKNPIPENGRN